METQIQVFDMQIILEIPEDFGCSTLPELEKQIKLEAGIALFHAGKISSGRACEFADIDRYRFYEECAKRDIPVVNYDPGELEAELAYLRNS